MSDAEVTWSVYGLVDIDILPSWYVQFYAAVTQLAGKLYKAALWDYAIAFEVFLGEFLAHHLTTKYGTAMSEYILRRSWRVEDRCKEVLELAIGHRLRERDDVYLPWDQKVRKPRDGLLHGERVTVDEEAAEQAHQAVYQAIRWVESVT
jgi:hypothetical protein